MDAQERLQKVNELLKRRVEVSYPSQEEVVKRLASEDPLTIYWGIDPTGPDVHLGHTIPLLLMREIAELGHKIILLLGDFTARIGDPTGKSVARVALTSEQVEENMTNYLEQVQKIIPKELFSVAYNSEWLSSLSFEEVLKLTGMVTVQQMIQRDMFQERLKNEKPIHMSEFLYPLMQGYDSVALRADGEVGGSDQTFNMLMGRTLAQNILGKDKMVLTVQLLTDPAGKKMSKSEGNLVALNDTPQEIRRKILAAVPDQMIERSFQLCTLRDQSWINEQIKKDPQSAKEIFATELIRMYHGEEAIEEAKKSVEVEIAGLPLDKGLVVSGIVSTMSAAHRLIDQRATTINGGVVLDWKHPLKSGEHIQVGKGKFVKVK